MQREQPFFPLFLPLEKKKIVVIGGGRIAGRRVAALAEFPCEIEVIAPRIGREMESYYKEKRIRWRRKYFEPEDLKGAYLVLAATNDTAVNDEICRLCRERKCLVNHAGNKDKSDFYFPGIVKEGNVVVAVTTSGENHSLAKKITDFLKEKIPGLVCQAAAENREE